MQQAEENRADLVLHHLIEETCRALSQFDTTLLEALARDCRSLQYASDSSLANEVERPAAAQGFSRDLLILEKVLNSTKANLDIVQRLLMPRDDMRLGYGADVWQIWR